MDKLYTLGLSKLELMEPRRSEANLYGASHDAVIATSLLPLSR
jgi:hypothetical protein